MDCMGAIRDESPLTNCSVKIQNQQNSNLILLLCGHVITQSRSTIVKNFVTEFKKPAISIEGKIYAFEIFKRILLMCFF